MILKSHTDISVSFTESSTGSQIKHNTFILILANLRSISLDTFSFSLIKPRNLRYLLHIAFISKLAITRYFWCICKSLTCFLIVLICCAFWITLFFTFLNTKIWELFVLDHRTILKFTLTTIELISRDFLDKAIEFLRRVTLKRI